MNIRFSAPLVLVLLGRAPAGGAAPAVSHLPVKEVTVFKDGHAFLLHEGRLPAGANGEVVLDDLPAPVIGTFWSYAADPGVKLRSTTAGRRRLAASRPALDRRELIRANLGARAALVVNGQRFTATILSVPERECRSPGDPRAAEALGAAAGPQPRGELVLLKTDEGVRAVSLEQIQDVVFLGEFKAAFEEEERRDLLTLKLEWPEGKAGAEAGVGMMYLQKGIRWIPSYKITIDGKGGATVELQATLLNELVDLEDVTMHLVIGVPNFAFKETLDPIALQEAAARLSPYFQEAARTAYAFSNAIMTQHAARTGEYRSPDAAARAGGGGEGTALDGGSRQEDHFVFALPGISLRKGERAVVPVARYSLDYRDVYTLDIQAAPPPETLRHLNDQRQAELARLFGAPKVFHKLRLLNRGPCPITTAPALIVREGRVLAQALATYTAPGATCDLEVTAAVDLGVKKEDRETGREPETWRNEKVHRIELSGNLTLTSHRREPVELEVAREVLGTATEAGREGSIHKLSPFEEPPHGRPCWWSWCNWPWWWHHLNGSSRIAWKLRLEPGETVELPSRWRYFSCL